MKKQLIPVFKERQKECARLITDLDNEDFKSREKASVQLKAMGELAEATVREALRNPVSAEARRRLENILLNLRLHPWPAESSLRS